MKILLTLISTLPLLDPLAAPHAAYTFLVENDQPRLASAFLYTRKSGA